jgi:hypothetical protein
MKHILSPLKIISFFLLLLTGLSACNKEGPAVTKAMYVVINGYNGTAHELVVGIDTTLYGKNVSNAKYVIHPASVIGFSITYTYPDDQQQRMVTLRDPESNKVLFSKPLPATGTKASFNFIYLDGKEMELTPPATDASTNKLGFYVHYAGSSEPFDMFLYKINTETGQEYRHYLAKNIKPGSWAYVDYIASADFGTKSILKNSSIYFTKAGTTDQWAFQDDENSSKVSSFPLSFPITGEKGLVQSYFIAPGSSKLDISRLYFHPDRIW